MTFRVTTSHSRTVFPATHASVLPSGAKAIPRMLYPLGVATTFPVPTSHRRIDPKLLPDATVLPSGLNAGGAYPARNAQASAPVVTSHTHTRWGSK